MLDGAVLTVLDGVLERVTYLPEPDLVADTAKILDVPAGLVVDIVARRIPSKFGLDPRRDVQVRRLGRCPEPATIRALNALHLTADAV